MTFFPRNTVEIHIVEPKAFRRLSFSLVRMAIIAGVVLRVYRATVMTYGSTSWIYVGGSFALAVVFLLGMVTAHIANYPVHRWLARVPLFVLVEVGAEMAVSALLISVKLEPNGATYAHWDDWVSLASGTLVLRGGLIALWSLLLALIVSLVRKESIAEGAEDPRGPRPPEPGNS